MRLFLVFLFGLNVFAAEDDSSLKWKTGAEKVSWERQHPPISLKYKRGPFLLYDCKEKHFVCAEEENFKDCEKKRKEELSKRSLNFSCTPFKSYETYSQCVKKHYELLHSSSVKEFCYSSL